MREFLRSVEFSKNGFLPDENSSILLDTSGTSLAPIITLLHF